MCGTCIANDACMRNANILFIVPIVLGLAACTEPTNVYDATVGDSNERPIPNGFERSMQIEVKSRDGGAVRQVSTKVRLLLQKGPARIETETFNKDGQRIMMVEESDLRRLTLTVEGYAPVVVSMAGNGQFEYKGRYFADQADDKAKLAQAIADQLEENNTQDDSIVASVRAIDVGHEMIATHGPKLFFIPVFADIVTEVSADMNIQMGVGNTATNN